MNQRDKEILMNAVVSGIFTEVEDVFNKHKLVFDESYFDYKLLQAGLRRRHQSILLFLINKIGCRAGNPNKAKAEETPLHLAMKLNKESIIKKILSKGALIFDKNHNGEIPLLTGFKNENLVAVSALLTHCEPNCEPDDKDAILHFHIACVTNHISSASHYLKLGVNPNSPLNIIDSEEYSGLNPVQFAAEKNYELFEKLVFHGGDLSVKNAKGLTPLHIIYYTSSTEDRKSRIENIFEIGNHTKLINAVDNNSVSHFHLSCMLNQQGFAQVFIDNGGNVNSSISLNCTVDAGFTPLHFAVTNRCERTVELLLKNGANCNKKDKKGRTPLHLAYQISGYWKEHTYKMLLDYKASPAIADKEGCTPVHMEFLNAGSDNKNILDMLFSKISTKTNFTNHEGLSLFHIACTTSNVCKVQDFLNSGVDVDSRVSLGMYSGYTALHFAVLHNQTDVVKLLLKKNALVNIKTKEFQVTPLHLACEFNHSKFCEENPSQKLEDFKYFPVDLKSTSNYTNQLDIIGLLLQHGAHVDAKDHEGMTPLLYACMIEKNYCKLKWSYNSHAYLSRLERVGLIKIVSTRLKEIIEILLSNKANVSVCSNNQRSILHIISECISLKIPENLIKLILMEGADIDAVDVAGLTPLHVAVTVGNNRMARILLRNNANVHIKCEDSKIPLYIVFKKLLKDRNERDIFCALLEKGSDANIKGETDKVLLSDAIYSWDEFIIEKLLQYGADINSEDSLGNSCVSRLFKWERESSDSWLAYRYSKVYEIIYIHVQKLLALGLPISKQVRRCCIQFYPYHEKELREDDDLKNLENVFHDCTTELERMKLIKIDNYTTLYSILLKDQQELSKHVRNKILIKTIKTRNLNEDFPLYSYLLKLQLKRGLVRSDLLKSAETSLCKVINKDLPYVCCDSVIKYLKNEDIANLKVAALLRRGVKRKLEDTNSDQIESSSKIEMGEEESRREKRLHLRNRVSKTS